MTLELAPGLHADSRRALWLEAPRALVLADLHLGYSWAHRQAGNLLPVGACDSTLACLREIITALKPAQVVLLGDIVHRAAAHEALCRELRELNTLAPGAHLTLVLGNHDRHLPRLLEHLDIRAALAPHLRLDGHLLLHGDRPLDGVEPPPTGKYLILGHAHPAFRLHDGVATGLKLPCFLHGPATVILPAFTEWAAGVIPRPGTPPAPAAVGRALAEAIVILGDRLLRAPLWR